MLVPNPRAFTNVRASMASPLPLPLVPPVALPALPPPPTDVPPEPALLPLEPALSLLGLAPPLPVRPPVDAVLPPLAPIALIPALPPAALSEEQPSPLTSNAGATKPSDSLQKEPNPTRGACAPNQDRDSNRIIE